MSENPAPLPYEVQEMTTTEARKRLPELVNMAAYGMSPRCWSATASARAHRAEEDAWVYSRLAGKAPRGRSGSGCWTCPAV